LEFRRRSTGEFAADRERVGHRRPRSNIETHNWWSTPHGDLPRRRTRTHNPETAANTHCEFGPSAIVVVHVPRERKTKFQPNAARVRILFPEATSCTGRTNLLSLIMRQADRTDRAETSRVHVQVAAYFEGLPGCVFGDNAAHFQAHSVLLGGSDEIVSR